MMGQQAEQEALFYEFSLERHVPVNHLLRSIDRFVDLGGLRLRLAGFYSSTGRPSVDPELLIRMLLVGYCYGIRSERRLCEEVHFCDPQLGCSNRLVAEDLSEEYSWQFNQEFRLASHMTGPLNFSVGGNFMHYET